MFILPLCLLSLTSSRPTQYGVGVDADPTLARQYYRQSGSAPAILGLWLMGASELAAEVGEPLAVSVIVVAATMLLLHLRRRGGGSGGGRPGRDHRPLAAAGRFGGGGGAAGRGRGGGGAANAMLIEREGDGDGAGAGGDEGAVVAAVEGEQR